MDTQFMTEQSLAIATQLHNKYNSYETLANLEYIKHLIEKINELKKNNRELTLNYNELYFDFANYKSEKNDNKESDTEYDHDAIDIY